MKRPQSSLSQSVPLFFEELTAEEEETLNMMVEEITCAFHLLKRASLFGSDLQRVSSHS